MKKIAILLAALYSLTCHAQSDTVYHYHSKDARQVSSDSAYSITKLYKTDKGWFGKEFYKKGNFIKSEGNYTDSSGKTPLGAFKNYNEKGVLDNIKEWENGKAESITYFYKNGSKKGYASFNEKGVDQQKGWDEDGKEIKNFVVEREAHFKGGPEGWRKYLEKNLNANVAADAGAPVGKYEVALQFIISKEGYVSHVKALNIPPACKPCAAEAINVLSNCPEWEPAVQLNEPVIYQAIQYITFAVEEGRKHGKG